MTSDDLYCWSDAPEARPVASEGTIRYERIGADVYRTQGGPRRQYCIWSKWPCSSAARRIRERETAEAKRRERERALVREVAVDLAHGRRVR